MEILQTRRASCHLDPDRLRRYRLQKRWKQRDLARAAGLSEDYISQLERAATTRNKGTRVETLVTLAQSLDVLPIDLLVEDAVERSTMEGPLHRFLSNVDTVWSSDPLGGPGVAVNGLIILRIDPGKLREARLKKQWKQRDLARASGFSEDYISQLERAATTCNKGTRLETILRLAQALEVAPVELLPETLAASLQADMTRRELLGNVTSLGIAELLLSKVFSHTVRSSFLSIELPAEAQETIAGLRHKAYNLSSQALWLQAEEAGLQARSRCREESEEWAEITLSHCAQARQQAGDILQAQAHIEHVVQHYARAVERPDQHILGLIQLQRGWIASEQSGQFEQGYRYFTSALQNALQVGDDETERTARHFRVRTLSELAMREAGAWLGARPIRSIHQQLLCLLHQSLETDWPLSCNNHPENLHSLNRRYMVYALIQPDKALREVPRLLSIARSLGVEHIVDLTLARWNLSNEEWGSAGSLAHRAFQGYCRAAFPQGIALAVAIHAEALFRNRLRTREDCNLCLDLWLLALLLHPYQSHPLWNIAFKGLHRTREFISVLNPSWYRAYYHDIDVRVERKDGAFQALQYIYLNMDRVIPTQYLDAL